MKITITIEDTYTTGENGVHVKMDYDPPMDFNNPASTEAAKLANYLGGKMKLYADVHAEPEDQKMFITDERGKETEIPLHTPKQKAWMPPRKGKV